MICALTIRYDLKNLKRKSRMYSTKPQNIMLSIFTSSLFIFQVTLSIIFLLFSEFSLVSLLRLLHWWQVHELPSSAIAERALSFPEGHLYFVLFLFLILHIMYFDDILSTFPSQHWDFIWFEPVQDLCVLSRPLCVHTCINPAVPGRLCFLGVVHHLWLLNLSASSSTSIPEL